MGDYPGRSLVSGCAPTQGLRLGCTRVLFLHTRDRRDYGSRVTEGTSSELSDHRWFSLRAGWRA